MSHPSPSATAVRLAALATIGCLSAATLAGCGSGGSPSATPTTHHHSSTKTSTRPTISPTKGHGSGLSASDAAAIKSAFVAFFSGKTPAARKIALVQNGTAFAPTINAQADSGLAKSSSASVSKVTGLSPTEANVVYTVSLGGTPALKNQTGQAVKQSGHWVVAASTFCALLNLEGNAPAVCKTVS